MNSSTEQPSLAARLSAYADDAPALALLLTEHLPAKCIDELNKALTRRSIFATVERTERDAAEAARR